MVPKLPVNTPPQTATHDRNLNQLYLTKPIVKCKYTKEWILLGAAANHVSSKPSAVVEASDLNQIYMVLWVLFTTPPKGSEVPQNLPIIRAPENEPSWIWTKSCEQLSEDSSLKLRNVTEIICTDGKQNISFKVKLNWSVSRLNLVWISKCDK